MRIRKRFPMSSTASSLSDPQLNNSTLVQQTSPLLHPMPMQHNPDTDSHPSDQTPIIINNPHKFQIKQKEEEEENGSNNTRKEYSFLAVEPVGETRVLPPLCSHQVEPLKKSKGAVEQKWEETVLMKSKSNKKCTSTSGMQQNHSEQDKAGNGDSNSSLNNNVVVKKMNKRGGAIMEGSRCSRVNGRGWRCCQQTLVGYSLCEHHLGKGRLRSISNVKSRTKAPAVVATSVAPHNDATNDSTTNDSQSSMKVSVSSSVVQSPRDNKDTILLDGSCYEEEEEEDEDEDDDDYTAEEMEKPVVVKKKRMKLGMVKARSLSSLLNQTN